MVCQPWSGRGLFGTPAPIRRSLLQVVAQSLDLVDQEVDVGARGRRVGDHHAEEVDLLTLRLVAHHGGPTLHHQGLDLRSHLHATGRTMLITDWSNRSILSTDWSDRPIESLIGLTDSYRSLIGLTDPYWSLIGLTDPYCLRIGQTQPYRSLIGLTDPYCPLIGQRRR